MKAVKFSNGLKEAGYASFMSNGPEPDVVVRQGPEGEEIELKHVKFRKGRIILEF